MAKPSSQPDWLDDHVSPSTGSGREESGGLTSVPTGPSTSSASGSSGPPIKVSSTSVPRPSAPSISQLGGVECIPRVRYFRKLFRGHVYPLVVQLGAKGGESVGPLPAGAQVEVQPFLPGAMVWPQKRTLQGDKREARFWVMPLAKGKLREGYVSISSGTGKAQELRVPMRVKEGRGWLFWLCLWLTLLLPVGVFILRALPVDTVVFEYTAIRPSPSTGEETAMPFKGRKAVEAWLEDLEAEAKAIPAQERSIRHWLMLLLGKGKPYLAEAYDGYEIMLQENMLAEPIVFVVMLLITLIVGWWTGAKRRTVVGEVMKVTGP